jgi:hypothetical protein
MAQHFQPVCVAIRNDRYFAILCHDKGGINQNPINATRKRCTRQP